MTHFTMRSKTHWLQLMSQVGKNVIWIIVNYIIMTQ